jgi:hypothetical protein
MLLLACAEPCLTATKTVNDDLNATEHSTMRPLLHRAAALKMKNNDLVIPTYFCTGETFHQGHWYMEAGFLEKVEIGRGGRKYTKY